MKMDAKQIKTKTAKVSVVKKDYEEEKLYKTVKHVSKGRCNSKKKDIIKERGKQKEKNLKKRKK